MVRHPFGRATYGIFDVFPGEDGRNARLGGVVAKALGENAGELYSDPQIEKLDLSRRSSQTSPPARDQL